MFCRNCGNQMSEDAKFCSKCGTPVQPIPPVQPEQSVQPMPPVQPTRQIPAAPTGTTEKAKKKKNAKKKPGKAKGVVALAVILAVVAAAAVFVVANASAVGNFVHKTFSSPQEYYRYVETQSAKQLASKTGTMYGMMADNWLNSSDRNFRGELGVELSEDGQEYLALLKLAGLDLTWLHSAAIGMNYSIKDDLIGLDTSLALNGDAIVSANMLMDIKEAEMYFRVPELTQTYLGIDMEMSSDSGGLAQFDMIRRQQEFGRQLTGALPSQANMEELVNRYIGIALECIDDVSIGTQNVKAGGIEQRLTELEVTIDAETVQRVAQAVLRAARSDKAIEKLIVNYVTFVAEYSGMPVDASEAYDAFCDEVNDILLELQDFDASASDGEIIMKVYVDNKGEIRGRVIERTRATGGDSSGNVWYVTESLRMLTTEKGKELGCELSLSSGDESISLAGSGVKENGEMSGDFNVKYNGVSLVDIGVSGLNITKAEAGLIEGTFEVQPSSKIMSLLDIYAPGRSLLDNLKLTLTFKASENVKSLEVGVVYNGDELGTAAMTVDMGGGSVPVIPDRQSVIMLENEYDADSAMADWLGTIDWDAVDSQLEKTDLPDFVIQQLHSIFEAVKTGNISGLEFRGIYGILR